MFWSDSGWKRIAEDVGGKDIPVINVWEVSFFRIQLKQSLRNVASG
jgi:hypothetical protein